MSPWPSIWSLPSPMVFVNCKRCQRTVAKYFVNAHDEGYWQPGDCPCDPPPVLPQGRELDRLVRLAWRKEAGLAGRPPIIVSR